MTQQKKNILVLELNKHSKIAELLVAFVFQAQLNNMTHDEIVKVFDEVQEAMDKAASEVLQEHLKSGMN